MHETAIRHNACFKTIDLHTQFRCAGPDEYVDWVDQLLEIRKTGVIKLASSAFEVETVRRRPDGPCGYDRAAQRGGPERPDDGRLVLALVQAHGRRAAHQRCHDRCVERPGNAQPDKRKLAPGISKAQFWATDPGGATQIGCIYTAQGFEFGYSGVIWGEDLVIRSGVWVGQKSASRDHVVKTRSGERFIDVVKNAYRVLLTRGMQGCSICILDPETQAYVENRL